MSVDVFNRYAIFPGSCRFPALSIPSSRDQSSLKPAANRCMFELAGASSLTSGPDVSL